MNLSELKQKIKKGELEYTVGDMAMSSALGFFIVDNCSLRCEQGCSASSCAKCVHSCSNGSTF